LIQDLRNHGESPHEKRHDYEAMADDVSNFIHEHGLKESSIIGHSMYEPHKTLFGTIPRAKVRLTPT
jgi:pimeloyl-ACP methyl ester carboxylesterase